MRNFDWKFPYPSQRMPVLAKNVVCTSQPLASQAGLKMLRKGGNAVDAALASAITLTVVEPVNNGIGSDAFAILNDGKKIIGLNASGKSPAGWTKENFSQYKRMPIFGWDATTVPGAVSAWVALWKRFGSLEFKELFEPAIKYAKEGFLVSPITATAWNLVSRQYKKFKEWMETFTIDGKVPKAGKLFKCPEQAESLQKISETEGESFYRGELAEKIAHHAENTGGLMTLEDLKDHEVEWVKPLTMNYKGVTLHEIPPNGQGIAALIGLGILKNLNLSIFKPETLQSLHLQLEAMKLAFRDVKHYIGDPDFMDLDTADLLEEDYLEKRANLIDPNQAQNFKYGKPKLGDTVYLTTADENGMMVSYIQSNYWSFGSGIVIPNTGISMQNRGNGFTLKEGHPNQVGPKKRPYHTIIPAFVTKDGKPLMSFGVMGGQMQPQGHIQMMLRIFEYNQNPQTACDAPRWRVERELKVKLEDKFDKKIIEGLKNLGHETSKSHYIDFGGAQIIYRLDEGYLGASEPRKDGQAVGF